MGHWGPWIQDPDITVAAGRNLALLDTEDNLGDVTHTGGGYGVTDINDDVSATTLPAVAGRVTHNLSGYAPSITSPPVFTELYVSLVTSVDGYTLEGKVHEEVLNCEAFPHGWSPPPGAEVEGGAEPVVITGHVELVHTQTVHAARTPDFTVDAKLKIYQSDAVGGVPTSGEVLVTQYDLSYVDSGSAPTFRTVVDLGGAALNGALFNMFVLPVGTWAFSSGFTSTDSLTQRVDTDVDLDASYYVWRPPRYRLFIDDDVDLARRLWPRTDSVGPAIGRVYPTPDTPQYGRRFGSAAPL